jgi:hypothetical protein
MPLRYLHQFEAITLTSVQRRKRARAGSQFLLAHPGQNSELQHLPNVRVIKTSPTHLLDSARSSSPHFLLIPEAEMS